MQTEQTRPKIRGRWRTVTAVAAAGVLAATLAACGGGESDSSSVTVTFRQFGNDRVMKNFLTGVKAEYERPTPAQGRAAAHRGVENDYYTKLQLMMRSPQTAPDVVYEDTFLHQLRHQGRLPAPARRLPRPAGTTGSQFVDTAKAAGQGAGRQDVRRAGRHRHPRRSGSTRRSSPRPGCPPTGSPRPGTRCSTAARTIKEKVPGVIPLNVYSGKAAGEAAAMQGFEMLLYGTGQDPLYDAEAEEVGRRQQGLQGRAGLHQDRLLARSSAPTSQTPSTPTSAPRSVTEWLPEGKLAIALDGSWLGQQLAEDRRQALAGVVREAWAWPRCRPRTARRPGKVSMSGGWTWAIPQKPKNPDLAWEFIKTLQTKENAAEWSRRAAPRSPSARTSRPTRST